MSVEAPPSAQEIESRMGRLSLSNSDTRTAVYKPENPSESFGCLARNDYYLASTPPAHVIHDLQPQLLISNLVVAYNQFRQSSPHTNFLVELLSLLKQIVEKTHTLSSSPETPEAVFRSTLDTCDKLWAESKIFEARWREMNLQNPTKANLLYIAQVEIKNLCDKLAELEQSHPELKETFESIRRNRLQDYPPTHPLRILQPFLISVKGIMPDYSIYSLLEIAEP